ncbi:MAG TPA: phosphoglycolate phosphatase [Hydrogenophaga sp.]|nr:phosphoglycolate phosphatase [Hydrogenophaga sp.]HBU18355.1 phosphoglycolate phosphatase [Hydrogenophaga sp.]
MVDTLGDFEVALNRTMADLGLPGVDRAAIERTVGKGSEHLIRSLLAEQLRRPEVIGCGEACPALSVDALYERAWRQYQHHYLSINGQFADVFAGVEDSLRALQGRGLAMACLTNKPLAFAQGLLAVKGLAGYFSRVFGGDSFERKKPDPLPLLKTCEALGTLPAQTLMVGDSENDALAARAAGCPVVLVSYGYNHGRPVSSVDADAWVDSMLELV